MTIFDNHRYHASYGHLSLFAVQPAWPKDTRDHALIRGGTRSTLHLSQASESRELRRDGSEVQETLHPLAGSYRGIGNGLLFPVTEHFE